MKLNKRSLFEFKLQETERRLKRLHLPLTWHCSVEALQCHFLYRSHRVYRSSCHQWGRCGWPGHDAGATTMRHLRFFLVIITSDCMGHSGENIGFSIEIIIFIKSMLLVPTKSSMKRKKIRCQMYGAFMHSTIYFLTFLN